MKLEVGEFYLSASREIVKIDMIQGDSFISNTKDSFFKNGLYINGEKHKFDLIAHIPKELHKMICELVNNYHSNNEAIKQLEELENRSCRNCKHSLNLHNTKNIINSELVCTIDSRYNNKDFYCNRWKNKQ